ncbi:MAG: helix-turn-helix domain-containing protein [Tabrizicola sp.]|nr:helix-turn-helix domain-containing protein [Tabrizicola sp.]
MADRSDIHDRLAASLRAARKERGLSLDAAAKLSGVSRSMVSQIERGESSPTVATLWALTQALQLDFAGLLEGRPAPGIEVTRASATPVIDRGGVKIRILSAPESVGAHEVYELAFAPGARLTSEAHSPGCREHLTVLEGRLTVTSGDASDTLAPGDVARYPADRAHEIAADGKPARAILIVQDS